MRAHLTGVSMLSICGGHCMRRLCGVLLPSAMLVMSLWVTAWAPLVQKAHPGRVTSICSSSKVSSSHARGKMKAGRVTSGKRLLQDKVRFTNDAPAESCGDEMALLGNDSPPPSSARDVPTPPPRG
jgi:hypothetical protein